MGFAYQLSVFSEPPQTFAAAQVIPLSLGRSVEEAFAAQLPLIESIAHKIVARLPGSIDVDELIGAGVLGFWEARQKYDASLGVPFRAYAELRIRGAMFDTLREFDWIGRSLRRRLMLLAAQEQKLAQTLGRQPDDTELAEALGVSLVSLEKLRSYRAIRMLYMEDLCSDSISWEEGGGGFPEPKPTILEKLCQQSEHAEIHRAMEPLSVKERWVVQQSFFEDRTLREIGERLGVTESRVCQIRLQALQKIERRLRTLRKKATQPWL